MLVAKLFKKQVIFIPLDSNGIEFGIPQTKNLLSVKYSYRASTDGFVSYKLQEPGSELRYSLSTMALSGMKPVPGELCCSFTVPSVKRGDSLRVNLITQEAWINEKLIKVVARDCKKTRKYIARLELKNEVILHTRSLLHYLPFENKPIGRDYYFGDDYTEYPLHTNVSSATNLVHEYCKSGRLLDIGCALGLYTKAFLDAGFDAYGIDVSDFAISETAKRIGKDRVRQCNLDLADIPFDTLFDTFWMWDVLEHLADPEGALKKVRIRAAPGAWLFLHTSNADSLSHLLLGTDWEGYSDYSHYGVDKVNATNLEFWLETLGWDVVSWQCNQVWVFGVDPVILGLRDAFAQIPELDTFLRDRELGDAIDVVARRRGW